MAWRIEDLPEPFAPWMSVIGIVKSTVLFWCVRKFSILTRMMYPGRMYISGLRFTWKHAATSSSLELDSVYTYSGTLALATASMNDAI